MKYWHQREQQKNECDSPQLRPTESCRLHPHGRQDPEQGNHAVSEVKAKYKTQVVNLHACIKQQGKPEKANCPF